MIQLSSAKAKLYEYMKTGEYSYKQLVEGTGIPYDTIKTYMSYFLAAKMAVRHGKIKSYTYVAKKVTYKLNEVQPEYKPNPKVKKEAQVSSPKKDQLVQTMIDIKLTDDQLLYLNNHRQEKRTVLAKKLGIPKVQLNFALERMG